VQIDLQQFLATQRGETPEKAKIVVPSIIFGFGHRARHGKDTAAKFIQEECGKQYDIRLYSFARELKEEVNKNAIASGGMRNLFVEGLREPLGGYWQTNGNILPLPEWVQYEENPDMTDPLCPFGKQRTLLQWWGTEYRRSIEPNYWVDRVAERLVKEKPEIALITDMRFPNEFLFVQKYGETIKVHRPGIPVLPGAHASEEALASVPDHQWSAVIYNDGTLEQLKQQAIYTFDELMEKVQLEGENQGAL
jgi:hypothetical protein